MGVVKASICRYNKGPIVAWPGGTKQVKSIAIVNQADYRRKNVANTTAAPITAFEAVIEPAPLGCPAAAPAGDAAPDD